MFTEQRFSCRLHSSTTPASNIRKKRHREINDAQAIGSAIKHVSIPGTPEDSVLSQACEAGNSGGTLDYVFTVNPSCTLNLKLYFSSPAGAPDRNVGVYVNDERVGQDYNIGAAGTGGDVLEVQAASTDTGLLEVSIRPVGAGLPAYVSGIQILTTQECQKPPFVAVDTTGESDATDEQSVLVYRMACSSLSPQPEDISSDLNAATSDFLTQQKEFTAAVGSANATAQLFESLCMPANDADHLEMNLPLQNEVTYEVQLYFTKPESRAWSDVLVTVDGVDAFPKTQKFFKPGPGQDATYMIKRFEARAGPKGLQVVVSAVNGFPPISGIEVWQITKKSAATGITLLDRKDGEIVVACGSRSFQQSPQGEVIYPGPQAFTSAGVTLTPVQAEIAADDAVIADLVSGGAFSGVCTAPPAGKITATFHVEESKEYEVTLYFAETAPNAAVGTRVLSVQADGAATGKGLDIFKNAGLNKAVAFTFKATSSGPRMEISVGATAGQPLVNAVKVKGPGIDAAAADRPAIQAGTGLAAAVACGAPGPSWHPIEAIAAAGFQKYTSSETIQDTEGESDKQALYGTHCFAPDGGTITLQVSVVPKSKLRIVLHFAEVFYTVPGKRVFDVRVNGVPQFQNVDIVAEAGPYTPLVKEITYVPDKSVLVIEIVSKTENAMLNALEIYSREVINSREVRSVAPPTPSTLAPSSDGVASRGAAPESASPAPASGAPPAAPVGNGAAGTTPTTAPVTFTTPAGATACVPAGSLVKNQGVLDVSPPSVGFGEVDPANVASNFASLRVTNNGTAPQAVTAVSCTPLEGMPPLVSSFFVIQFGSGPNAPRAKCGQPGVKAPVTPPFSVAPGNAKVVIALFEPTELVEAAASLYLWNTDTELAHISMTGVGGNPWAKAHTLHPVIDGDLVFVEADNVGGAEVFLDGSTSHTHAPGRTLAAFLWEDVMSKQVVGKGQVVECFYPFGTYTLSLTITDDAMETDITSQTIVVAPESSVPGTLLQVFTQPTAALDPLPALPTQGHLVTTPFMAPLNTQPAQGGFVMRMLGEFYHAGGPGKFGIQGVTGAGSQALILLNGTPLAGADFNLPEGSHSLDVRMKLAAKAEVSVTVNGAPITSGTTDVSKHPPIINELSTDATAKPGNIGLIKGFLLSPPAQVFVGNMPANITEHERSSISFHYPNVPPGEHPIVVKRKGLSSNSVPVTIISAAAAAAASAGQGGPFSDTPKFVQKSIKVNKPSRVLWCHGKIYAANAYASGAIQGGITEFTVNSKYDVVSQRVLIPTPQPVALGGDKSAWSILGLACDPREDDANFKLYFTHCPIFSQGGEKPTKAAPYYGQIMYVEPNAAQPKAVPLITNIASANGDHQLNGLDFLHDGRLIYSVGSHTNAGIPGALGWLPENPGAAGVFTANIRAPAFDGTITYGFMPGAPATHTDATDQRFGDWTEITSTNVELWGTGTRNPYGIKVGQKGNVMLTINGPNIKFGPEQTGVDASGNPIQAKDPETDDAIYIDFKKGCHAGHPNIARCRAGSKHECAWTSLEQLQTGGPVCAPDAILPSSIGGIMEYNSYTFGGALHGKVYVAGYKKHTYRFDPEEGKSVADKQDPFYPASPGIDIVTAPAGVHLVASLEASKILINIPVDAQLAASGNPSVYDIHPSRASVTQAAVNTFIIGGANFDSITGPLKVTFGAVPATGVKVAGPEWITGVIPSNPAGVCGTNVTVAFGATTLSLPEAFCYLKA